MLTRLLPDLRPAVLMSHVRYMPSASISRFKRGCHYVSHDTVSNGSSSGSSLARVEAKTKANTVDDTEDYDTQQNQLSVRGREEDEGSKYVR